MGYFLGAPILLTDHSPNTNIVCQASRSKINFYLNSAFCDCPFGVLGRTVKFLRDLCFDVLSHCLNVHALIAESLYTFGWCLFYQICLPNHQKN